MDPRVRVALIALKILEKLKASNRLRGDLREIRAKLMEMKWVDDLNYLKEQAEFFENFDYSKLKYSEKDASLVRWCINVLKGLGKRLERGKASSILFGLDVDLGEVLSVHKLNEKLKVCKVNTKFGELTVVTNIKEVKKGDKLPLALLPPKKFGKVTSEAMFLWKPVKSLKEVDWRKVEGEVSAILEEFERS